MDTQRMRWYGMEGQIPKIPPVQTTATFDPHPFDSN